MVLHPDALRALDEAADELPVHHPEFDIERTRSQAAAAAAQEDREEVAEVRDVDADGVPCRLYRPEGADALILHLHGGGFVLNDIEVHDPAARRLANRSRMAVLSVDFRRPPEHHFPAAPDDVDTVLGWLASVGRAEDLALPTYGHGDSAGANLALVAALRNPGRFEGLALIYPFLDPAAGFDSYDTAAEGFDRSEAQWYWQQYAATEADLENPDLAPLRSDRLGSLPPTLVVTAEHDPLRDEGEHLAARLAEEGVDVLGTRYLGLVHGFWRHADEYFAAEPLTRQVAAFLRMLL